MPIHRYHQAAEAAGPRAPEWGDPERPLVYVTFGSVVGSLPPFAGVYREALDALADLDACVVMTVGRNYDAASLGPLPTNAYVVPWLPQARVLAHAAAMVGHGGFGTTMGALAAGVPQVVVPLFSFDQIVNGEHVEAVGAGVTTGRREGSIQVGRRGAAPRAGRGTPSRSAAGDVAAALRPSRTPPRPCGCWRASRR